MISTFEIKEISKKYKEQCENQEFALSKKNDAKSFRKLEKELLQSRCIYNLFPEDMNRFYSRIHSIKITEYTEFNSYDIGLMDISLSGCSKLYLSTFPGSLENNERLLEWIRNIRYIVSTYPNEVEFAESITKLRKDFYGMDTFQIKAPRLDPDESDKISPERLDCLTHEIFVGMFGLNPLRKQGIPNFAYVYGGFESSPAIIQPDSKKILAWGSNETSNEQILYSIFENTNHKETLNESCKYDTYEIILSHFLQVVLALRTAYEYCQFTHYNLHTKNVLLRRQSNCPLDIEYTLKDNKKIWIRSPRGIISTIQEYSTSYINVNVDGETKGFGYNNYEDVPFDYVGIYNDKPFVIGDVYKLVMHILGTTSLENKTAYNHLKPLFSFFSQENIEEAIKQQKDTYLHLPYYERSKHLLIDDFIQFVLKKYENSGVIFKTYQPSKYGSFRLKTSGTCFEKEEVQKKLEKKADLLCIPKNTIQLYDFIKYYAVLHSDTKDAKYIELINKVAQFFEEEFSEDVIEVEQERFNSISSVLSSRFLLQEISYNVNILRKESIRELYKSFISKGILYMNAWERMKTGIKVLEFISKGGSVFKVLYQSYIDLMNKNKTFYEAIRLNLLRFYTFFACYNVNIENHGSILQGIHKEKHYEMIREIVKDPDFQWYFLTANFLKSLWM